MGVLLLASAIFFLFENKNKDVVVRKECTKGDLSSVVRFEGAAGSIYANFEIKNISNKKCVLVGENSIQLQFDPSVKNIKETFDENSSNKVFTLDLGASVSAVARIPNGPQCGEGVSQTNVGFTYTANNDVLTFSDLSKKQQFIINNCLSDKEITRIDISSLK